MKSEEALREKARREKARRRLLDFVRYTFPAYEVARHLELLAGRLEAVERRECGRLMVFMPPRHGKSELASVRFPAWYLGRNPDKPIIFASYAASLAHSKSRECRNLIEGALYQNIFGKMSCVDVPVELSEQRAVQAWRLAGRRGGMLAAGVGGGITGHTAKLILIDDPVKNREEANSLTTRERNWGWYASSVRTRCEADTAIIVIQTRWHEDDLAGRLLRLAATDPTADQWEVLHLPAIDTEGRALWPARFPVAELNKIKASVGDWEFEALYQGNPRPPVGVMFTRSDFVIVEAAPPGLRWVRYVDLAISEKKSADYNATVAEALAKDGTLYLRDMIRCQGWDRFREQVALAMLSEAEQGTTWAFEDAAFQVLALRELLARPELATVAMMPVSPEADKVTRARPLEGRAKAGRVKLVRGPWVEAFLLEMCDFPFGQHDDQVDTASGGLPIISGKVSFADIPQAPDEKSRWQVAGSR